MVTLPTIKSKMEEGAPTTGFDYLRIVLSLSVLLWHSIWYSGSFALAESINGSLFRFTGPMILPLFFALSGFLVTGSLQRTRLHQFVTLRVLRLVPALAVEVTLSALVLGVLFTTLPLGDYCLNPEFHTYFLNIVGIIQFTLPGVFQTNPGGPFINPQLWTVPVELECYVSLVVLAILTLTRKRLAFLSLTVGACIVLTVWPIQASNSGRQLVLCFLAAVTLYLYRDVIPYSNVLGTISTVVTVVLLLTPGDQYLVPFAAAYSVVWFGLMRPPAIPFGDLSYGVYLFHMPVEQTIMHLFPGIRSWWLLSLVSLPFVLGIAWLSWNLIEYPILTRKKQVVARVDRLWDFGTGVLASVTGRNRAARLSS